MTCPAHVTLVVHQAALGDWVLTFPLLRSLVADGPLVVATGSEKAALAQRLIPGLIAMDVERPFWASLHGPSPSATCWPTPDAGPSTIHRLISFVSKADELWAANARRLTPPVGCYFVRPRPPEPWPAHVTAWHQHQLARQGWSLPLTGPSRRQNPTGSILIHPGSGGRAKCWPIERSLQLAQRLAQQNQTVRFILGEAEVERGLTGKIPPDQVVIPLDLTSLASRIESARLFIGNDSGPTHLAAQLGIPTLAFFGPSRCDHWHPLGPQAHYLKPLTPSPMDWLSVDQAHETCLAILAGKPT